MHHTSEYGIGILASMVASRSQQNAQQKQTAIIGAASQLILQQGYVATSMDEVAALAGITKQTVYRYYPSKRALLGAVLASIRDESHPRYRFAEGSPASELVEFGRDVLAFHLTPAALGVYRLVLSEGGKDADLLQTFQQAGPSRVVQMLTEFLARHYPGLEDAASYAELFMSMLLLPRNQLLAHRKRRISRAEQRAHVDRVVRLFLDGLPS
ncbi:MAG: TetR/AcrR family transcriptional regulator [Myxococcales bacterium]|nr:TetR/AcrR family transcriptional regulator [Myxococcales bacterium]